MTEGGMAYKDQSAFGLRHTLIEGEVGMDKFHVLKSQSNVADNFSVGLHIIGASHVAEFRWPDFCVTEIFACMDASQLGKVVYSGQLSHIMRKGARPIRLGKNHDVEYGFVTHLFGGTVYKDVVAEIEQDLEKNQNGLIFEFPKGDADIVTPKTIVQLQCICSNSAIIRTVHSYPNERMAVITKTKVARE